jgi:predicted RNA-binding protein with PUA-like domain
MSSLRTRKHVATLDQGWSEADNRRHDMAAWLFQGNPQNYTLDTYLRENKQVTWRVRQQQYVNQMKKGDQVFLWRSDGGHPGTGGVVAVGVLTSEPGQDQDDGLGTWFQKKPEPSVPSVSVRLDEVRLTHSEGFLSKQTLLGDPVLCNLGVIRMPRATNYRLTEEEAEQLLSLWTCCSIPCDAAEGWRRLAHLNSRDTYLE